MATGETFRIVERVRRAKAFFLAGSATVRAVIQHNDGTQEPESEVPIESLLSPKSEIDVSTPKALFRWDRIWHAVQSGQAQRLRPITIERSKYGTPIKDVTFLS
jgi:hypothetical protein